MFPSTRPWSVVLMTLVCLCVPDLLLAGAAPIIPCEIGPMLSSTGSAGSNLNGKDATTFDDWKLTVSEALPFDRNEYDGFSHNYRWFLDLSYTHYRFDELFGETIAPVEADILMLEVGAHVFKDHKRMSRVGIRVPHVDVRDTDVMDPYDESGLGDIELFADFGFGIDRHDDAVLTGLILETRATLPTADEEFLGREGGTLGARLNWFWRWTRTGNGSGARITQVHFNAGLGYVLDFEIGDNSFVSPTLGVDVVLADRVFLRCDLQGELHDSGVDQWDLYPEVSVRLNNNTGRQAVFLHAGARVALNDDGLRDDVAPTFGVRWFFGVK